MCACFPFPLSVAYDLDSIYAALVVRGYKGNTGRPPGRSKQEGRNLVDTAFSEYRAVGVAGGQDLKRRVAPLLPF